jgi:hypothetical protein
MEEGLDWKIVLILAITALAGLVIIMPAITGGSGIEIPAIGGTGKAVCDLAVTVNGIWQHNPIPYWTDTVAIDRIDYGTTNWRRVLFSSAGTLSLADTGDGKVVWELYDDAGNKVKWGEVRFELSAGWSVKFTVKGITPGSYQLKVEVQQYWDNMLGGKGWDARDSKTISVVVNQPSNI